MSTQQYKGLNDDEVLVSRKLYGDNGLTAKHKNKTLIQIKDVVTEPMFIILVVAAIIYFVLGESSEGFIMLAALFFVAGISVFQESRSRNAVDALRKLTSPGSKVFRSGILVTVDSTALVKNDIITCEDGDIVPADCAILAAHDFSVNESMLTGESLSVFKNSTTVSTEIYKGTIVVTGSCIAQITAVGNSTSIGKIGISIENIESEKTPLQKQINRFIFQMVIAGLIAFFLVWGFNIVLTGNILHGLLHGLTLAMSVLPEEIPVAFSTFLALGAYRLYKKQVIAKSPQTVESLGAATVICLDKTGTLTENNMQLAAIYNLANDEEINFINSDGAANTVLDYAMWASETIPFDAMEKAIHIAYERFTQKDERKQFKMVHEYPLAGTPPIMTHIYTDSSGNQIIACKGGVETLLAQSKISAEIRARLIAKTQSLAELGFRVLAVGKSTLTTNVYPENQTQFIYDILGLIAFYDPPKKNTSEIIKAFYDAGIDVKMITGDYAATANTIANQIGLKNGKRILLGTEVVAMQDDELCTAIKDTSIFARMFPDAKLKVVEALKRNGEITAMTGDGVNDGPALKAAHIGIAMGKRGTETAKLAASLILTDDNLEHMVEAIALGRRIYDNLKKAIRYIISIHIPIILIVTLPLLLFWEFTDFFNPLHVIILELIMGPTCSIIFENEPAEPDTMHRKPHKAINSFFSMHELTLSIVQGLIITAGCLIPAYIMMQMGSSEPLIRTTVYATLIFSNVLLTLTNRSFLHSLFFTLRYKNNLVPLVIVISISLLFAIIYIEPVQTLFKFESLSFLNIIYCLLTACIAVLWVEVYKHFKRKSKAH